MKYEFMNRNVVIMAKTVAENWVSKQSFYCFDFDDDLDYIF